MQLCKKSKQLQEHQFLMKICARFIQITVDIYTQKRSTNELATDKLIAFGPKEVGPFK